MAGVFSSGSASVSTVTSNDPGYLSASQAQARSGPMFASAKPSVEAATLLRSSTYEFICVMFESSIALKTPLINSVTNRGKETALRISRVVPATLAAETPLNELPALACARASTGRAGGFAAGSFSSASWARVTAARPIRTIASASNFRRSGSSFPYESDESSSVRTALRMADRD